MALSQPKFLDIPFANSSNQRTDNIPNNDTTGVGNASWEQGFPPETMIQIADGGVPPRGQDMNGILNQICKILQYVQTGTLFQYNSAFANSTNVNGYPKGALVLSTDKVTLWRNTVEGNKTNPDSGGAGWVNFLADLGLYLPLAGGTMTGTIKVPRIAMNLYSDTDELVIYGSSNNNTKGPCVALRGISRGNDPGSFYIRSGDGDSNYVLLGKIDGTLTWNGNVPATSDDSTKIATTAYVKDCVPKSIGSATKLTYTNSSGVLTASGSTVGSADTPVYMSGGEITTTGKSFSSYLPLVGGTSNYMTGTIYSSASGAIIRGKNSGADVGYQSQTNGNYGIYDYLNEGWGLIFAGSHATLYSRRGANINYIAVRDSGLLDTSCNQLRLSDGTYTNSVITVYNESTTQNFGSTILIGAANQNQATPATNIFGGAVYVGSGESSGNLYKALGDIDAENAANNQSTNYQHPENLFLSSDLSTDIFVRCQTIAERNLFRFDTDKLVMFDTGVVRGTQPQTDQFKYIQHASDEKAVGSGNALSEIRFGYTTGKRHQIEIRTSNDSGNWYTGLGVYTDAAGTKAYTYAPTPDASDSSTKIATTEWVKTLAGAYLPLAGGTMTGQIKTSYTDAIVKTNDTGHLTFCGGSGYSNGASIFLSGKSESSNTGLFRVRANDGTNTKDLTGKANGSLTWVGNEVLTAGNYSNYALPLTGGTITGNLLANVGSYYIKETSNTYNTAPSSDYFRVLQHQDKNGAAMGKFQFGHYRSGNLQTHIVVNRPDNGNEYIGLRVCADANGTTYSQADGNWRFTSTTNASGTSDTKPAVMIGDITGQHLELDGNELMSKASATTTSSLYINGDGGNTVFGGGLMFRSSPMIQYESATYDDRQMTIRAGNEDLKGGALLLFGRTNSSYPGNFILRASTKTGSSDSGNAKTDLLGKPDGTLTWGGSNIYVANKTNVSTIGGAITRAGTGNWLRFTGGETDYTDGASCILYGKTHSSNAGNFGLRAYDGTHSYNLTGYASNGRLNWNGTFYNLNAENLFKVTGVTNNIGNGALISGTDANYGIQLQSTGITKGTTNATTYRGTVEWYGNTRSQWKDRLGMLEFSVTSNKSTAQLVAYNVTTAENTNTCAIGATVDASGNAATFAPTPAAGDNSTKIATTAWVTTAVTKGANMPPGTIVEFAGTSAPSGWLYCNGAAVSRTTYAALFSAIGTGYGTGNGSSTFNLPDFRNRVPQGGSSATDRGNIAAGLPNITGTVHGGKGITASGAFTLGDGNVNSGEGNKTQGHWFSFDANDGATAWNSNSAGIYGNSTTVQPPAVKVMFIIKT